MTTLAKMSSVAPTVSALTDLAFAMSVTKALTAMLPWAKKYVGTWSANDICNGTSGTNLPVNYSAIVTEVSDSKIHVKNFGGFDVAQEIDFTLTTANEANLAGTDNGGRVFSGTATLGTDGRITYTYKVTYSDGTFDDCTGTMSK